MLISILRSYLPRGLMAALLAVVCAALSLPARAIDLADYPLFSTVKVPGNLVLALSVEWPTATTSAYMSTTAYATGSTFIGYFDSEKCYQYVYNSTTPSSSYFLPISAASSHSCASATQPAWSGNYLNWASMQTLDEFRWIMTGGYRSTDTNTGSTTDTILTKTYAVNDSTSSAPDKATTTATLTASGTPFTGWTTASSRIRALGNRMWITRNGDLTNASISGNGTKALVDYIDQGSNASNTSVYQLYINVAVCVSAALKEDNCVLYGSTYKPEGLMQTYAMQLRFSAFSYLNHSGDSSVTGQQRDGGVLRARMNYIGPKMPVPGSADVTNAGTVTINGNTLNGGYPEWSATTGIMATNPDSADAADTVSTFGLSSTAVVQSGVMNYLNKFGNYSHSYKSKDPVAELYNAVLRYYKGLANWAPYTSATSQVTTTTTTTASAATYATYADGFPVITKWRVADSSSMGADPILYSCQKNFILGMGDVNTHRDANLYGSTLRSGSTLDATPTYPTDDTSVNVATATNMVGTLEGNSSLGSLYGDTGSSTCSTSTYQWCDTYYVAGLAYDAHTVDLRSDWTGTQTINTYWLDVMENQTYRHKNQYWLAAKYGGFTVPSGFSPYSSSNSTSTLSDSTWYTNTDTSSGLTTISQSAQTGSAAVTFSTDTTYDKRPDNYYFGSSPATMKSSLTAAFNKISSELSEANSTTYAMASPNVVTGSASYSASYDPSTWTGSLISATNSYDTSGNPTPTPQWNARDLLEAKTSPASTRKIITYCDSATTPAGIAFTATAMAACPTTGRLYYPSFASITGTTSTSSTAAADYLAYLRGDRTNELSATVTATNRIYRKRSYLLGDFVGSKTNAVGAPSMPYYEKYNAGYTDFKRTYAGRKTVVYAGSNDGMLHAFDGTMPGTTNASTTATCSTCGQELFGFIPSFVYGTSSTAATSGLASFGSPTRSHYYLVDATPVNIDVDVSKVCSSDTSTTTAVCSKVSATPDWRTLLIGGLGKGGKGYYAMDITNPGTPETTSSGVTTSATYGDWTSETSLAAKVLWEFPKTGDTTTIARMGYSFGEPSVMKTAKYGWVVIFTSGYNNSDGKGYLYVVNPKTGALLEKMQTPTSSNGLAQASAYVADFADNTADAVYAADLDGQLWRFDLTAAKGSTSAYPVPTKLATLADASSNAQPVTTAPLIEINPVTRKRFVLLGTGKLLDSSDVNSKAAQSFYALIDGTAGAFNTVSTAITRANLTQVTDVTTGTTLASTSAGWYIDLGTDTSVSWRMVSNPVAYNGVVAFSSLLTTGDACSPSGQSRVYAINYGTGKSVLVPASSGYVSVANAVTDLRFVSVDGSPQLIAGTTKGDITKIPTDLKSGISLRLLNWREVPAVN